MKTLFKFFLAAFPLWGMAFKRDDSSALYKKSLTAHLANVKQDTVRVLRCVGIELPSKVGKYTIIQSDNVAELIQGKKSLRAVKLMPIHVESGVISITIVDYVLTKNANEITLENEGGEVFSYVYNTAVKQYTLTGRKKHTI